MKLYTLKMNEGEMDKICQTIEERTAAAEWYSSTEDPEEMAQALHAYDHTTRLLASMFEGYYRMLRVLGPVEEDDDVSRDEFGNSVEDWC